MAEESNALVQHETWHLVPYHDGMNLLSCKWVYWIKYNSGGSIERKEARLVVRGFG